MSLNYRTQVTIIGAGFTGLSAAYELARQGIKVTILEAEPEIGGLASAFDVGGAKLDRFYHHWFTNDLDVMNLIDELGLTDRVEINPTNTGIYFANSFYKLSTPLDLLKFSPLGFFDRLRLGFMALKARRVKNWMKLEGKSAHEWLRELGGETVYRIVWQPLLRGKFGPYAEDVSAVWFWNKLKLRGGSRGKGGEERLAYFKGGFIALANGLADFIRKSGCSIHLNMNVNRIEKSPEGWNTIVGNDVFTSDHVIVTTALPIAADFIRSWAPPSYIERLERIKYIGNICLVLELDRSLSKTYWLNVNDSSFPFVGVIEHTNFAKPETYNGRYVVYLSKYLPHTDPLYSMNADEFFSYSIPFLKKMFPSFDIRWVMKHHLWRARWSQPVVEKNYSKLIPEELGPDEGFHICSMAQIYPEDRGTNYAIRNGRKVGINVSKLLK